MPDLAQCPSPDDITAFVLGTIGDHRCRATIAIHAANCRECLLEIIALRETLEADEPETADALATANTRAAQLQSTIDRIARALGTFPLPSDRGVYEIVVLDGDEFLAMRDVIEGARKVLSETGDFAGDYQEEAAQP